MGAWSSGVKGAHGYVMPGESKGEGPDLGKTLWESCAGGCGLVVLGVNSSVSLAVGQDWQSGGSKPGPKQRPPNRCSCRR